MKAIHLILITLFASGNLFSQNLFYNGGFELGDTAFTTFAKEADYCSFEISQEEKSEGEQSLKLLVDSVPSGGPQVIGVYQYLNGLSSSNKYIFRFAVKGPAGQKIRARIQGDSKQIDWHIADGNFTYFEWSIDELKPSANDTHKIGLEFGDRPENAEGGVWYIDDWSLTETSTGDTITPPAPGNLEVVYVSPDGDDNSNAGTYSSPFKTASYALTQLSGDTLYLLEGVYHENIQIDNWNGSDDKNKVITAYPGHQVIFDGTMPIETEWEVHNGNIYKTVLDRDIYQLFQNSEMLNAARWPNVNGFIEDEQPLSADPLAGSLWDQTGTWGKSADNSTEGVMIDNGNQDLPGIGFDLDSAIAILNVGSFKTSQAFIESHTPGDNFFEYDPLVVGEWLTWQKPKHAYYYIEGKLELLDTPGEWFYDPVIKTLYVMTKDGLHPDSSDFRGRTQEYAVQISNSGFIHIKDINLFGTTITGSYIDYLTVENCHFSYPAYSKRMLRSLEPITGTNFWNSNNLKILNNVVEYSEGEAMNIDGQNQLIENNLFRHIDFSCVNLVRLGGTINFIGNNNIFRNNTLYIAGASETLTPGSNNIVEGNEVWGIGHLQNDGSMIQYMKGPSVGSVTRFNWLHDCKKSGQRYDGELGRNPPLWEPWSDQTKGQVYKNVIWNVPTGNMVKGDYHVVVNNTVFSNEKVSIIMSNPLPPEGGNPHSICKNNIGELISGFRGGRTPDDYPIPGDHSNNWNGFYENDSVHQILQDVLNRDFRPRKGFGLIDSGTADINSDDLFPEMYFTDSVFDIGAYEYGDSVYNIAGRRYPECTHPVPFDKGTTHSDDIILAWRPAYKANSYNIYLGNSMTEVENAGPGSDVFKGNQTYNTYLPGALSEGTVSYWRIDAVNESGTVKGNTWSFTAGKDANQWLADTSTTPSKINDVFKNIHLYPNPVAEVLNLEGIDVMIDYKLFDLKGLVVKEGSIDTSPSGIELHNLSCGMYILHLFDAKGAILRKKIIKK